MRQNSRYPAAAWHHADNHLNLFGARRGTHEADGVVELILDEPPDCCESLDDDEFLGRDDNVVAVVEEQALGKFISLPFPLASGGKSILRILFGDRRVVDHPAGIADEF